MQQNLSIKNSKIGYYGEPGSNTHEAMLSIFDDSNQGIHRDSFEEVFKLVVDKEVSYAVLPIENTSTGGVNDVLDLLNKYEAYIVGESCLKIEHRLLVLPEADIEDIKEVYSHPQGLMQCRQFLSEHKAWKLFNYYNTAKSAQYVKECGSKEKAAIGNVSAAKLYGLKIIEENISLSNNNFTRFIIISNKLEYSQDCDKMSIILKLPHTCGTLYNVIKIIYESKLNMMKIESRPIIDHPWQYSFHIDFEGNIQDKNVIQAIDKIKEVSSDFRLIGNYRKSV
ncbi:prephenate dehydratase [Clostridium sp. 19966]|uniref:prephenate dehydratase n=1 Tax=Clostridium sp. 19966 TaxID=2768166 RepID=UPI0028DF89F2|nr:prephenate dehydratase [Clostridium sp. 19966]MDT8718714.1 prephenate dehydratase [Clostridium sp. 19966]